MKCPKCQAANREGVKFCEECGAKLELTCPGCGAAIHLGKRFCGECGKIVGEPKAPHPVDYSQPISYTPKHLADKILAARTTMEGERKQVTVLFADVKGFTSISEKLDPEEMQSLISECLVFFTEEIHRYEGTIAQFLGDGVMALFGGPIAHEDAPQRALYAALSIRERLTGYSDKLKKQGIDFNMRIGLNTGLVVVGRIGDDLTMEYTAMGDTVNIASRMESTAQPGTIQVSDNTYRLTEGYFEFKPLGKIELKGKTEAVEAYQLLSVGRVKTRLGVSEMHGLTPFVGRRKEFDHLMECYDKVKEGKGQVVGIVGEPGMGKSRLLLHLRSTLPIQQYTYLEGRCFHYGGSMAYLPLLDILRACFGITEGEREFLIKKKVAEKIAQLDDKLEAILPPLHEILSLKVEDEEYLKLEPQKKRERTFEAIRDLLIRESQNRPLILAVDDLQWIDKTSEEFLNYFIGWLANRHILLVILYRPEYTHLWASKSCYSQIRVEQLPINTSAELVQSILEGGEVVPELRELILNRAIGNPLFMEEFTHTLMGNGTIKKKDHQYVLSRKASEIQVPDTIQGIVAARMDRLEDNLKRTMQVASVIGKDFAYRILHTIMGMQEDLKSYLVNLQGLEFIYEKSLFPELEYMFRHALTQEVAYNSLLLKRRKEIHERIGKAIEELYPERLEEFYEMLAYHFSNGGNWEKAYQYLKLSGEKAQRNYGNWEAFRFYKEAIKVLDKLPETKENRRIGIEVRLSMEGPMKVLAYPEDSLQILEGGEKIAKESGDDRSLAIFYSNIGLCYTFRGDSLQGRRYAENCFEMAAKIQDIELMAPTAFDLCSSYTIVGEYSKMVHVAPRVISMLDETQRKHIVLGGLFSLNLYSALNAYYGQALGVLGEFEKGKAFCEEALHFAKQVDNLYSIAFAEIMFGCFFNHRGDGEEAIQHLNSAIQHGEEGEIVPLLGQAWGFLGLAYYFLGDFEAAAKYVLKGIEIQREAGLSFLSSLHYLVLGMIHLDSGDLDTARCRLDESLKLAQNNNERWVEGICKLFVGRVIAQAGISESSQAEEHIRQGIRISNEIGAKPWSCVGSLFMGELYGNSGHKDKALESLRMSQTMFNEMGMDYWLRKTQSALEKLQG